MATYERGSASREADHPVDPLFVDRWSPRALSGETIETERRCGPIAMRTSPKSASLTRRSHIRLDSGTDHRRSGAG